MSLNVNRSVTDAFYRYKMPRIQAKVEGKGNGIKTVVVNMVDVAKALARPATYTTKYFGCELGAQTQFDFKNDRYIVNGSHDANKLQTLLDGFIKKFVLCPECDNPETTLTVLHKKQLINQVCKACGYRGLLDMRHKLTTFILKNPPDVDPAASGSSLATPSKGKSKKRKSETDKLSTTNEENEANGSPGGSDNAEDEKFGDEDDGDWGDDVSEGAVKERMQMLTGGAKALTINDDLEKSEKERVDILYEYVRKKRDEGCLTGAGKELVAEAERLDIKDKAPLILSELLMDKDILNQIKKYRLLFLRFTHENKKAQKAVLGGVEQVIQIHQDALLPKVPYILKLLYDSDIVEEEVLSDWGKKVSKKYISKELSTQIHAKAEPFLKWLAEAEEEEESSDEEDIEIIIDDRAPASTLKEEIKPAVKKMQADDEDLEDLDIDDI